MMFLPLRDLQPGEEVGSTKRSSQHKALKVVSVQKRELVMQMDRFHREGDI